MEETNRNTSQFLLWLEDQPERDRVLQDAILHHLSFLDDLDLSHACRRNPYSEGEITATDEIDMIIPVENSDENWGVYCRYHAPSTMITADDIREFITACETAKLAGCVIISTANSWTDAAIALLSSANIPARRFWFCCYYRDDKIWDCEDFSHSYSHPILRYQPSDHEQANVIEALSCFLHRDLYRTGAYSFKHAAHLALMVTEKSVPDDGAVLIVFDDMACLSNGFPIIEGERHIHQKFLAICEDAPPHISADLLIDVAINPDDITRHLLTPMVKGKGIYGQDYMRIRVVLCEDRFLKLIHSAQEAGAPVFDLAIIITYRKHIPAPMMKDIKTCHAQKRFIISDKMDDVSFIPMIFGKEQ